MAAGGSMQHHLGSFSCAQRKAQRKAQEIVHGLCSRYHAWATLYTSHQMIRSARPTSSVFCKALVSLMRHLTTRSLNLVRMSWPCCCNCSGGQRSKTMRARKEYVLQQCNISSSHTHHIWLQFQCKRLTARLLNHHIQQA